MFLKRVEMHGFKSFADQVVVNFENPITGIVGPNGCGKSNISDAVRWVLGEQSVKALRGTEMNDVIFSGSADRAKVNMAEVTLVFDNTNKLLNSDLDEIEITRRIYRGEQGSEFFLNRKPAMLKDVRDLIMDTGLGKNSLSMISQGNIQNFAEAKPIDRRAIFEDAAGVSKYKKRKMDSLSKLERTKENMDRTQDILNELERQVNPLKRQAKKAEVYREKKQRLQEIEIAVLVDEIETVSGQIEEAKKTLFNLETQNTMYQTTLSVQEGQNQEGRANLSSMEKEINSLQEKLMKTVNEIQILETRKIELDEKRKYIVESGTSEEKIKELQTLLEEAKVEFEDRKTRLDQLHTDISLYSEQLNQTAIAITEATQSYDEENAKLRRLQNRREVLENLLKDPFNNQAGVKSIMDNANAMPGILGVLGQVMIPQKDYEEALAVALGGSTYNIVTQDEASARNAISFLKKNQSGRATFLPLTVLVPHPVARAHEVVCEGTKGYLGPVSKFVSCDPQFEPVKDCLLQNILVCDTLENGNQLATLLKFAYNIVTLDGDVIHKGGSMTGGKARNSTSLVTVKRESETILFEIDSQKAAVDLAYKNLNEQQSHRGTLEQQLMEKRITMAQLEPVVDAKRAKYERTKSDLDVLQPSTDTSGESSTMVDDLISQLNTAYSLRDEITTSIRLKREARMKLNQDLERKDQQMRQIRRELEASSSNMNHIQIDQARMETKLETSLQRLASEYQLTFEFAKTKVQDAHYDNAKEEVLQLRTDIDQLGNVNMNAPEEFTEVNERYEFLKIQLQDLTESRNKILNAIDEMDRVMKKQFKETFDDINANLNETFRALFGGGKARLILEDENDLLNTGIDVDVQPPGKSVKSISLFSGGEKAMIAICVLFTILKVKPIPLCFFDEMEAALDQGNVERVAKYIHKFVDTTQFIIITHRPGTMEECDVLYGVTMQKQGVSQMLRVELKDAMDIAEPSA